MNTKILYVSYDKYVKLHNKMKQNISVDITKIGHPFMTELERSEAIRLAFDPPIPRVINYHNKFGMIEIRPKKP